MSVDIDSDIWISCLIAGKKITDTFDYAEFDDKGCTKSHTDFFLFWIFKEIKNNYNDIVEQCLLIH